MRWVPIFATTVFVFFSIVLHAQSGLLGEYFNGTNFDRKVMSRVDAKIDFNWNRVSPAAGMNATDYSIRWTGRLLAPKSGKYVFSAKVDDGIRVWVSGVKVIDAWGPHDHGDFSGSIVLEANKAYDLKVEYYNGIFEGEIQLLWVMPEASGFWAKPVEARYFSQPGTNKPAAAAPKPIAAKPEKKPAKKTNPPKKASPPKPKPTTPVAANPADKPPAETPTPPTAGTSTPEITARQRALELKYIYFVKSKDIILPDSKATLNDWVIFLQQKPDATIDIAGHTDDLGNDEKNQLLSEQRAQIVADYLVSQGLDKSRIRTRGYGGTKPIYVNPATEQERGLNRRVEIRAK